MNSVPEIDYEFANDCWTVIHGKMKGGAGTSTATLLSAVAFAQEHPELEVLLICADPTTYTLTTYFSRLLQDNPDYDMPVHLRQWDPNQGILTQATIGWAKQVKADVVFIDLGPDRRLLEGVIGLADLVVASTQPKLADVERVWAVSELAKEHKKRVLVSLNRMAVAGKGQAKVWRETISDTDLRVSAHEAIDHLDYANVFGFLKKYKSRDDELVVKPIAWFGAYGGLADELYEAMVQDRKGGIDDEWWFSQPGCLDQEGQLIQ